MDNCSHGGTVRTTKMKDEDYPGLYQCADVISNHAQKSISSSSAHTLAHSYWAVFSGVLRHLEVPS
jgi:hypothetical protein